MKQRCDKCGQPLPSNGRAKVGDSVPSRGIWSPVLWTSSFAVWTFVSLAATATIYEMYRVTSSGHVEVPRIAGMEFSQILTYAPLTPFFFVFAARYPLQRGNWLRRSLVHLAAGILFTVAHLTIKAFAPYGYWDPTAREWTSAIWDPHRHALRMSWMIAIRMFWGNVVDDVSGAYIPIALIAHVVAYYSRFREREIRTTQLEGQLAKAHLQTLKSQLQPHFLFNTLNSISALIMMTDVAAADRMMVALGDLLRMSLDEDSSQMTTLAREIEFLSVYLEIERIRFEDKLRIRIDAAANCLDAQVPHLLLQPLVENAVKHGISKLSEAGEVEIVAKRDGDHLQIFISDSGPGLSVPIDWTANSGLGLRITKERLSTLYGSGQAFEIRNRTEGGVQVSVRIPFAVIPPSSSVSMEAIEGPHMMSMRVEPL